eukprot:3166865-Amphidinium_carterae.1
MVATCKTLVGAAVDQPKLPSSGQVRLPPDLGLGCLLGSSTRCTLDHCGQECFQLCVFGGCGTRCASGCGPSCGPVVAGTLLEWSLSGENSVGLATPTTPKNPDHKIFDL